MNTNILKSQRAFWTENFTEYHVSLTEYFDNFSLPRKFIFEQEKTNTLIKSITIVCKVCLSALEMQISSFLRVLSAFWKFNWSIPHYRKENCTQFFFVAALQSICITPEFNSFNKCFFFIFQPWNCEKLYILVISRD